MSDGAKRRLTEYRRKRSFDATPEPKPEAGVDGERGGGRFVVHEHHARRLHWDLRLERDGALASWAVPNGIPKDPRRNRKAVHVEDHPLGYIDFEGTIPAGSYGAGEVTVWDRGVYSCEKWEQGKIVVVFHGERLNGRYALFRAGLSEKDWMIHRMDPPADPRAEEMPDFIKPMLAKPFGLPSEEREWAFEVKWDGVRAIAHSQPGRIRFLSRNENDVTAAYPELRALNRDLGSHEAILDGEIVAFDENGRPSFQALQRRMHLRGGVVVVKRLVESVPVTYVVFDLLWLDGHSFNDLPYTERRARLDALKLDGVRWRVPKFQVGDGSALLAATREQGLEGVVAKRLDSRYTPGGRAGSWLKIKSSQRQELVIGGWTTGKGSRSKSIGALHLGVHDEDGKLRYAGRVGTGFDAAELERLSGLLEPLAQKDTPFTGRQPPTGAHYVKPTLVCEVEFTEWTRAGTLRQPVYKGLREDKAAGEVVRERITAPEPVGSAGENAANVKVRIEHGRKVRGGVEVEVEGCVLKLTNLDKVLYPKLGFTKADLIGYYTAVAPVLLPHLHDRPLTLKRYPDGVEGEFFYEKQSPAHRPDWVQTTAVWSGQSKRDIHFTLCQDLPTLVWLANLADIELHPSLSLARELQRPTTLAFDLDPGPPANIVECCEVAVELREMFDLLELAAFAKTSGSKGLQVYVPLNDPDVTYEQTKPFAHAVANLLERRRPELVVSEMLRSERTGKVLVDWSQNDEHKTTVNVYSLRAKDRPTVSTPVEWSEVEICRDREDPELLVFDADAVLARVAERGDLFAGVHSLHQSLPELGG